MMDNNAILTVINNGGTAYAVHLIGFSLEHGKNRS